MGGRVTTEPSLLPCSAEIAVALEVLFTAEAAGVRFRVNEGQLQFGPRSSVTHDLRDRLTEPTTKQILTGIVAGAQELADAIFADVIWQCALDRVDLPPEIETSACRAEVFIDPECEPNDEASEEFWPLMSTEDHQYAQEKPQRVLPKLNRATGRPVDWPAEDYVVTTGKHRGKSVGAVAASYDGREYLRWILEKSVGTDELRSAITEVLGDFPAAAIGGK